jgi:hypothetical protein
MRSCYHLVHGQLQFLLHANSDGSSHPSPRLDDGGFHVVGEIVREVTMAAAMTNLKSILMICGDRQVFCDHSGPPDTSPCCAVAKLTTALISSASRLWFEAAE